MKELEIVVDGKKYQYLKSVVYEGKTYVAFTDEETVFINEYTLTNNKINLNEVEDSIFEKVKKEMGL